MVFDYETAPTVKLRQPDYLLQKTSKAPSPHLRFPCTPPVVDRQQATTHAQTMALPCLHETGKKTSTPPVRTCTGDEGRGLR